MTDWNVPSQLAAWLFLALGCQYLARGDSPIDLAVWLAPVFLLRFFRDTGTLKALLIALAPLVAVNVLASRGILPIPSLKIAVGLQIYLTVLALLPFVLDSLAHSILPGVWRVLLFPSLVVAIPFVRSVEGTYLHPVNGLADLALLQVASLAGVAGVWFVINLTAAAINEVWERRQSWAATRWATVTVLGCLLVVYAFGSLRLRSEIEPTRLVGAAAIVPAPALRKELLSSFATVLRPGERTGAEVQAMRQRWTAVFHELLASSVAAGRAGFDLAAWSEGAAIVFKEDEGTLLGEAAEAARASHIHLALAFVLYESDIQRDGPGPQPIMRNELVLISPTGEIEWRHDKSKLAPGMESAFTIPGDGRLNANALGTSGAICYEMDFPRYIGQVNRLGADLLLAPSNDWAEIKNMHARSARLRAIENGVAVFRPAAGGISIAVDAYGRTLARADSSRSVDPPMTAILPLRHVPTLYAAWGNWLGWVTVAIVGLCAAIAAYRIARGRGKQPAPPTAGGA